MSDLLASVGGGALGSLLLDRQRPRRHDEILRTRLQLISIPGSRLIFVNRLQLMIIRL